MALSNDDGILTPAEIIAEMREAFQRRHTRAVATPTLTKLAEQLADAGSGSHTHSISEVTGLPEELAGKADAAGVVRTVNGAGPDDGGDVVVATAPDVQDTGWRKISLRTGWSEASVSYRGVNIRRVGNTVMINARYLQPTADVASGTFSEVFDMPAGFAPSMDQVVPTIPQESSGTEPPPTTLAAYTKAKDTVQARGPMYAAHFYSLTFMYFTDAEWPATLPGTAVAI